MFNKKLKNEVRKLSNLLDSALQDICILRQNERQMQRENACKKGEHAWTLGHKVGSGPIIACHYCHAEYFKKAKPRSKSKPQK